jgi:hypothetical protein
MRNASALAPISLLSAARTIIFRNVFVHFTSVALVVAMVQVSLVSLAFEQIEGTYEGTFTINQVTGEHQISLTFQQSGSEVTVTYRSALGGRGSGKSTIAGNIIATVPLRSQIVRDYSRLHLSFLMTR